MAPGYGVNLIGGYDWASILNNPYYQMAWQTPNINFKGGSTSSNSTGSSTGSTSTSQTSAQQTEAGAIPVTTAASNNTDSGSSIGTVGLIGGSILAAGGVYWAIKNGKLGQAGKAIKSMFGSSESKTSSIIGKLQKLTAVKGPDGEIRFMIPGKTKTLAPDAAEAFVSTHGLKTALSVERKAFVPGTSNVSTFICKSGEDVFTVKVENGVISGVRKDGEEILSKLQSAEAGSSDALTLDGLNNILKELGKEAKAVDETVLNGVSGIEYANTFGDDILEMSLAKYGAAPELRQFTTLERFAYASPEVQGYKLGAGEAVFTNKAFHKDGKLVDGLTVGTFSDNIGGGNIGNFEGQTLVSITKSDGSVVPAGSAGYQGIVDEYQKEIDKLIRRIFVKREYIPKGATIVTI